jgi:hypothetical protein
VEGFIAEMEALKEQRRRQAEEAARRPSPTTPPPMAAAPPAATAGPLSVSPPGPPAANLVSPATTAEPEARSAPVYKRWWFWATIGAVAVAGGLIAATTIDRGRAQPFQGDLAPGVVSIPGK